MDDIRAVMDAAGSRRAALFGWIDGAPLSLVFAATYPQRVVSSTVKDLVAGSGISFEDRGTHELHGVPGEWHLYAARDTG